MKTFLSISIFALATLFVPTSAYAAINVVFQTTPLFGEANFLPGDVVTRTVTVTNTGANSENVYTELLNVIDGGLSPMVDVKITGGALFDGTFNAFDTANKLFLSSLAGGSSVVYTYQMSFKPAAGNVYQNKSLGFDICVGFSGGAFECDKIDHHDGGYSQSSYGGGGGYSQGSYGGGQSSSGNGSSQNGAKPIPQVLGAQTSVLPVGAPNTGFVAGSSKVSGLVASLLFLATLLTLFGLYRSKKHAY